MNGRNISVVRNICDLVSCVTGAFIGDAIGKGAEGGFAGENDRYRYTYLYTEKWVPSLQSWVQTHPKRLITGYSLGLPDS